MSRESPRGIQDAFVDLLTLSKTRYIYGSWGSTFSLMAHYSQNAPLVIPSTFLNPLCWNYFADVAVGRFLRWNNYLERWEIWSPHHQGVFVKIWMLMLQFRCRFFCSDCYQLYVSRYLTLYRLKRLKDTFFA